MRIVVFGVFARFILLIAHLAEPKARTLSGRLAALRFWPSCRKRPVRT
jgi:hypothetical protein